MESSWASLSSAFVNFSSFRMQQPDFWLTCRNIHTYPTTCGVSYTGFQLLIVLNSRLLRWFGRLRLALLRTTLLNCAFQLALKLVGGLSGLPREMTFVSNHHPCLSGLLDCGATPSVRAARGYMVFSKLFALFQLFDIHVLSAS